MSTAAPESRSFLPIELNDLQRLAKIAHKDREDLFNRRPKRAEAYRDRVLCIALCQGAAKHFIDGKTGIHDFDVYTFYRQNPKKPWYAKRIKNYDFGDAKFGQSQNQPEFIGRRVDCVGRAICERRRTQKALVLLEPDCGTVVWPILH